MLNNIITYQGYHAEIRYDPSADAFHGRVLGMRDVISFYGRTPEELRHEMQAAIQDYLGWCAADGAKPEKSWSGKLTLRSDADVRHRILLAAAARGQSVSAWLSDLADRESRKILAELENQT